MTHSELESAVPIIHDIKDKSAFDTIVLGADEGRSSPYDLSYARDYGIYENSDRGVKVAFIHAANLNLKILLNILHLAFQF